MDPSTNRFTILFDALKRRLRPILDVVALLILLFVMSELVSFSALTVWRLIRPAESVSLDGLKSDPRRAIDVYRDAPWSDDYFDEFDASYRTEYAPYTDYRRVAGFQGRYINIDERGLRRTVPECSGDDGEGLEIFFFGGSAAWGTGARDEATIPSWLARKLCDHGVAVRVTNYGESGYTSTQELVQLGLELQHGRMPDIVVFYDGVNDVYSSWQNGIAGLPQNVVNRRTTYAVFEQPVLANVTRLVSMTQTGKVAKTIVKRLLERRHRPEATAAEEAEEPREMQPGRVQAGLDEQTVAILRKNIEIVRALERGFSFRTFFYWQPAVYNKNTLSADEREKIAKNADYGQMYLRVTEMIRLEPEIRDVSGLFDGIDETVFIDEFHISEDGNERVAQVIFEDLLQEGVLPDPGLDRVEPARGT